MGGGVSSSCLGTDGGSDFSGAGIEGLSASGGVFGKGGGGVTGGSGTEVG